MKNQHRARGQQSGKQTLRKQVPGDTQIWEKRKGDTGPRWRSVSECAATSQALICVSSHTSLQISVKQQLKPHQFFNFFLFI